MNIKMLTVKQVSERLGVSEWTVRRLMNSDPDFPHAKIGGRRMVNEESLVEYVRGKEESRERA